MSGSNNDLNILDHSQFFQDLLNGSTPIITFIINNKEYTMGYYLVNGIYPEWHFLSRQYWNHREGSYNCMQSIKKGITKMFNMQLVFHRLVVCGYFPSL